MDILLIFFKIKRLERKARPEGPDGYREPQLFFDVACFFIESVRAMSAAAFATIASLEVVFFGETFVAFGG